MTAQADESREELRSRVNSLASFLPSFQLDTIRLRKQELTDFRTEYRWGAVLFFDISGFSAITESLSRAGPAGAEKLAEILNLYFGQITRLMSDHGGDLLSLAGDAALGIWMGQESKLQQCVLSAAAASLEIQKTLADYQATPEVVLKQRASIGAGRLLVSELGGFGNRWKFFVAGQALEDAAAANYLAPTGGVLMVQSAWDHAHQFCDGTQDESGLTILTAVRSSNIAPARPRPAVDAEHERLIGSFLPSIVSQRVQAGQVDWLAEFRTVSIVFIGLGMPDWTDPNNARQLQLAIRTTQELESQYEATFLRFLADDKGTTMVVCFGLPPLAHEDDPARAVRFGLDIQARLSQLGLPPSIGVTTGRAFCGACGAEWRRQYSIYGPVINLASRIMQIANGRLLCDRRTREASRKSTALDFRERPPVTIKGFAERVAIFQPSEMVAVAATKADSHQLVGREREREQLTSSVMALASSGDSSSFLIEGESGIGKSHLLRFAIDLANQHAIKVFLAAAVEPEKLTPYAALRPIVHAILDVAGRVDSIESARNKVLQRLAQLPEVLQHASLLNPLLPFDIKESAEDANLSPEGRAELTQMALMNLIESETDACPMLFAIDNAQWLDSASWHLIEALAKRPKTMMVLTSRTQESKSENLLHFVDTQSATVMHLDVLSADDIRALICARLNVSQIPYEVARVIQTKTSGNPFFSEELAYMLRDVGLIEIRDGQCRLAAVAAEKGRGLEHRLDDQDIPSTVQSAILRRLDRLTQEQLLTVKIASAIGKVFRVDTLQSVHPLIANHRNLDDDLAELTRLNLITPSGEAPHESYRFCHTIIMEVAYESMVFSQRCGLHEAIAEWIESNHQDDLSRQFQALAWHWNRAENTEKAQHYMARAGEQSLENFANQEAVRYFTEALELHQRKPTLIDDNARGLMELRLGRAFVNWSKYQDGRARLEAGLRLFGNPIPSGFAAYARLTKEALWQMAFRKLPLRTRSRSAEEQMRLREAARAYEALMEIYFNDSATEKSLYAAVRSLNLAEAAGPSEELARAYGAMGALVGIMGMRRSSERYFERALQTAVLTKDPSTEAWVALAMGVYSAGLGNWQRAEAMLGQVLKISKQINDRRRWEDGAIHLAFVHFRQGRLESCMDLADQVQESTRRGSDDRGLAMSILLRSQCLLRLNQTDEAVNNLEQLTGLNPKVLEEASSLSSVIRAVAQFKKGNLDAAEAFGKQALTQLSKLTLNYESIIEYSVLAEFLIGLASSQMGSPQPSRRKDAAMACRLLTKHSNFFPGGKAQALQLRGLCLVHSGNPKAAMRAWKSSIAHARKYSMPYDEARTLYQMGLHAPQSTEERIQHLRRAVELLEQCGASVDLAEARQALSACTGMQSGTGDGHNA